MIALLCSARDGRTCGRPSELVQAGDSTCDIPDLHHADQSGTKPVVACLLGAVAGEEVLPG